MGSSRLWGGGREELPYTGGQGQWPRVPDCNSAGTAGRSYPVSEVRGGSQEELPHAPTPEARGGGGRTKRTSKEPWLRGRRRA